MQPGTDGRPPTSTQSDTSPSLPSSTLRTAEVQILPIRIILPGESPRLGGMDEEHVRRLAEMESTFPPILVHRATMRVIDGMHRLRAATLTGKEQIAVEFFEGSDDDGFLRAVQANVTHGLPLTLADRRSAALRILVTHPHLSDRAIGACTGLAHKTVSSLRSRSTGEDPHLNSRLGADGRMRPLSSEVGRRRAAEVMAEHPEASLREVAATAGISVGTAHDVRQRLQRGESPVWLARGRDPDASPGLATPRRDEPKPEKALAQTRHPAGEVDVQKILQILQKDPSLKGTESGRALLHWLHTHVISRRDWEPLIGTVPAHQLQSLAALARQCADMWEQFAHELKSRENLIELV